ncbi:MAG: alpha/beta fold hydrolase [Limnobacter sp.]|nr:alpha/beta fold hydrolase [Limnobacter sp.]
MALSSFLQTAKPRAPSSPVDAWGDPQLRLNLGGHLAVWCEKPASNITTDALPWLILHGGPGGSLGPQQVVPLRNCELSWFGFDQRNSGLSEDLPLQDLDIQRFVDDAFQVADKLNIERFRILAGSWGATLALMMAASHPERVRGLVLRAPFIPWRARVDAFFASLESLAPSLFAQTFGARARTLEVCQQVLESEGDQALSMCALWAQLEEALLINASLPPKANPTVSIPEDQSNQQRLLRKYKLQAHFLFHDSFTDPNQWQSDISVIAKHRIPLHLVQGGKDRVCPPAGAHLLNELVPHSTLTYLADAGHLSSPKSMLDALTQAVGQMRWR